MKEVEYGVILEEAKRCYQNQTKWHFHIMTPTCTFNTKRKFAIIFENEETGQQLISTFDQKPLKQGEGLEELFYGRV